MAVAPIVLRTKVRSTRKHYESREQKLKAFQAVAEAADGADLYSRFCRLLPDLAEADADAGMHPQEYVRFVLEAQDGMENREDARTVASHYANKPPEYTKTATGRAALRFETWLIREGGNLLGRFVETALDDGPTFLIIFEGQPQVEERKFLHDKTEGWLELEYLARAGAIDHDIGEILECTIIEATPVGDSVRKMGAIATPSLAEDLQGLLPQTAADYRRVVDEGGVSRAALRLVFGTKEDPCARAVAGVGEVIVEDANGVPWVSTDAGVLWVPRATAALLGAGVAESGLGVPPRVRAPHHTVSAKLLGEEGKLAAGGILILHDVEDFSRSAIARLAFVMGQMPDPPEVWYLRMPPMKAATDVGKRLKVAIDKRLQFTKSALSKFKLKQVTGNVNGVHRTALAQLAKGTAESLDEGGKKPPKANRAKWMQAFSAALEKSHPKLAMNSTKWAANADTLWRKGADPAMAATRVGKLSESDACVLDEMQRVGVSHDYDGVASQIKGVPYASSHKIMGSLGLTISFDAEADWKNKILENSRYVKFLYSPSSGKLNAVTTGLGVPKKFRGTRAKTPKEAVAKINAYIKQIQALGESDAALEEGEYPFHIRVRNQDVKGIPTLVHKYATRSIVGSAGPSKGMYVVNGNVSAADKDAFVRDVRKVLGSKRSAKFEINMRSVLKEGDVEEGVNDPNILKAVFMAGSSGAGKSFIANSMFKGTGFKVVNSDSHLERLMKKAGLDVGKDIPTDAVQRPGGIRDRAKGLTAKQQGNYINGRLGLIIDGTAKKPEKIARQKKMLEELGYDTHMIFVSADVEVAIAADAARARTVGEKMVRKIHSAVMKARGTYKTLFGRQFYESKRTKMYTKAEVQSELVPSLTRIAMRLVGGPLRNPIGKKWIETQRAAARRPAPLKMALAASIAEALVGDYRVFRLNARGVNAAVLARPDGEPYRPANPAQAEKILAAFKKKNPNVNAHVRRGMQPPYYILFDDKVQDSLEEKWTSIGNHASMGDLVDQNTKAKNGTGKAKIDAATYAWIKRRYGKTANTMTKLAPAVAQQRVEINGKLTSTVVTPLGDYLKVKSTKNNSTHSGTTYYAESVDALDEVEIPVRGGGNIKAVGKARGRYYMVRKSGLKDSFTTDEKFRYALAQELASQTKASKLMQKLGESQSVLCYERDEETDVVRSRYGSWALTEAPVEDGVSMTTVLVRDRGFVVPASLEEVVAAVDRCGELYEGLPEHGDVYVEAFLREYAEDKGTVIENASVLFPLTESVDYRIRERDELITAVSEVSLNEFGGGRGRRSYGGDPSWIKAKRAGRDKKGLAFKKGEEVLYYPNGKHVYAGKNGEAAWRDFQSRKGDEEGRPYAESAVEEMIKCPACEAEIDANANPCPACGHQFKDEQHKVNEARKVPSGSLTKARKLAKKRGEDVFIVNEPDEAAGTRYSLLLRQDVAREAVRDSAILAVVSPNGTVESLDATFDSEPDESDDADVVEMTGPGDVVLRASDFPNKYDPMEVFTFAAALVRKLGGRIADDAGDWVSYSVASSKFIAAIKRKFGFEPAAFGTKAASTQRQRRKSKRSRLGRAFQAFRAATTPSMRESLDGLEVTGGDLDAICEGDSLSVNGVEYGVEQVCATDSLLRADGVTNVLALESADGALSHLLVGTEGYTLADFNETLEEASMDAYLSAGGQGGVPFAAIDKGGKFRFLKSETVYVKISAARYKNADGSGGAFTTGRATTVARIKESVPSFS